MKLLKYQIEALRRDVISKENDLYDKNRTAVVKSKKVQSEAKIYFDLIHKIPKAVRGKIWCNDELSKENIANGIVELQLPKRRDYSYQDVESKIIIEAMKCKNIDELMKKLNLNK